MSRTIEELHPSSQESAGREKLSQPWPVTDPVTIDPLAPTPKPTNQRCLIIVPAFNERQSVGKLVRRLNRALPWADVLVIDDGSTDGTARQVPPGTALVRLPFNLGIGGAMQTGYRYADLNNYDIAIQVDGDGQHRPQEVPKLIEAMIQQNADLVVGSRFMARPDLKPTGTRLIGIRFLSAWIRLLAGLKVEDCTSGFRAVNRRVIRAYAHWYPEDYPEPEVVLLLHRSKFKVIEIPTRMRRRMYGKSSINLARGLFYVVKVSTCLLLDMVREPWPSGQIED